MSYAEFMHNVHQELSMLQVMLRRSDIVSYGQEALADVECYLATILAWKSIAHPYYAPRTQVTPEQTHVQQLGLRAAVFSSTYAHDYWIKSAKPNRVFSAHLKNGRLGNILRQAFAQDFILPNKGLPTFSYFQSAIDSEATGSLVRVIESAWIKCGYPTSVWKAMGKPACLSRIEEYAFYAEAAESELTAIEVSWVLQDRWSIMFPDQNLFHEYAQMPFRVVSDASKEHTKENYLSTLTQFLLAVASAFLHDQGRPCDDLGAFFEVHTNQAHDLANTVITALEAGESVTNAVLSYVTTCFPHIRFTADEKELIHRRYTLMYLDRGSQIHGFNEVFMRSYNPASLIFHYQGAHSIEWSTFFTQIATIYPALQPTYQRFSDFFAERQRAFAHVSRTADNILVKPTLTYTQADLLLDDADYTREHFFQYPRSIQMTWLAHHPEWLHVLDRSQIAIPLGQLKYTVQDLLAAGYSVADLRLCEFTIRELWEGGVSVWRLYKAQYAKLSSLKNCFACKLRQLNVEVSVEKIQQSGGDPKKIVDSRLILQTLRDLRCSVEDFAEMGFLPYTVYERLYPYVQWMEAELDTDFYATLTTAYQAGREGASKRIIPLLRALGYSLLDLCQAGFSARLLRETCQISVWEGCALGFRKQALAEAGFPAWQVRSVKAWRRLSNQVHIALPPSSVYAMRVYKGGSTDQKPTALVLR